MAIVEPAPTTTTVDELDPVENVPESNDEPSKDESEASSQENDSCDEDDIDTDMQRVFVTTNSVFDKDVDEFDPENGEEKYHTDYNKAFNDNEIFRRVAKEPTY